MSNTGLVSILVLNHNKAAYSAACLDSLLYSTYSPLEVIAVDNGSADATPTVLQEFREKAQQRGIHCELLTNDSNVGAIVGRNQALERATGEYLAFVDNDVLVRDRDWLEKLRSALEADPQTGIVSAKLLFPWPPHALEFAGCAVTPNGRIQYLGRGEAGDAPEHNEQKEVQCVISACLMFRRALVEEIGMLDEVFSPVQYEDLDFCYRARAAGYRVLYVPSAAMYHYEHTTTSRSVDLNFQYVTIRNGMTFKKRWQHVFASEGGPTDEEAKWRDLPRKTIEQCPPPVPQEPGLLRRATTARAPSKAGASCSRTLWTVEEEVARMASDELKPKLKAMIVERLFLNVAPEDIKDDESLMDTYNIDSVALFEVVVGLEEDFGVSMEDDEFSLDLFENVNSVAEFVEKKLAGGD